MNCFHLFAIGNLMGLSIVCLLLFSHFAFFFSLYLLYDLENKDLILTLCHFFSLEISVLIALPIIKLL